MSVACPRCGAAAGESRWCETCGRDLRPQEASLPTGEAIEAGRREAEWLQEHPEVAAVEDQEAQAHARARADAAKSAQARRYVGHEVAQDPSTPARMARWSLIACAGLGVVLLGLEAWHLSVLGGESSADSARIEDSDFRLGIGFLLQFGLLVVTMVMFIVWLHRVYSNLRPLGAFELRFGTGWAIGSWFVPILNLWRPKQIVNDCWRASNPELGVWANRREWVEAPVPGIFLLWWWLFVIEGFFERLTGRLFERATTIDAERTATIVAMFSTVLWIVTALLAVLVVDRVTARQNERAAARERMVDPGAMPGAQPVGVPPG